VKVFFIPGWRESKEGQTESKKILQLLEMRRQELLDAYVKVDTEGEEEATVKLDDIYFVRLNFFDEPDATYLEISGEVEEEWVDARVLKHQRDSQFPMRVARLYEVGRQDGITEVKLH
jgi:hypothetical protein